MMRVDYDSEADALSIELRRFERYDYQRQVDDDFCTVGFAAGSLVHLELLAPAAHLDLLEVVAERYELDVVALLAAARAGLAAPDRLVDLNVASRIAV